MYYLRTKVAADVIKLTVNEVMSSIPALGSEDALLFERGQEYAISIEEQ